MIIYLNGQDIGSLSLGLVSPDISIEHISCSPEEYLKSLDEFLRAHALTLDVIEAFVVVRGPGSPTALRSSLALVNTLAFAKGIKLYGIEKAKDEADEDALIRWRSQNVTSESEEMLTPIYDREVQITAPTRDALKRTL